MSLRQWAWKGRSRSACWTSSQALSAPSLPTRVMVGQPIRATVSFMKAVLAASSRPISCQMMYCWGSGSRRHGGDGAVAGLAVLHGIGVEEEGEILVESLFGGDGFGGEDGLGGGESSETDDENSPGRKTHRDSYGNGTGDGFEVLDFEHFVAGDHVVGVGVESLSEGLLSSVFVAEAAQRDATEGVGLAVVRIEFGGALVFGDGFVDEAFFVEGLAEAQWRSA